MSRAQQINEDWDEREFAETIQLNVAKLTTFLSKFDQTIRLKLSGLTLPFTCLKSTDSDTYNHLILLLTVLNEKINRLERTVTYCEASAMTTAYDPQDEGEIVLNNKDDFSESHTTLSE